MKVLKIELMIINFDDVDPIEVRDIIENTKYPNHCISPSVMSVQEADIGEWSDDHPLNQESTQQECYDKLFSAPRHSANRSG